MNLLTLKKASMIILTILLHFLASINLVDHLNDIKYDDNSECKFDNLEDVHKALLEESLKGN